MPVFEIEIRTRPAPQEEPMSGSARTVQPALDPRKVGAAILAAALAVVFAVVLVLGPLTATKPVAAPAGDTPAGAAPPIVTPVPHRGTGGGNPLNIPQ
jgi:hypothetical protein